MKDKKLDDGDLRRVGWRRAEMVPVVVSDRMFSVGHFVSMFDFLVGMTVTTRAYKSPAQVTDPARIIPRSRR